MIHIIIRPITRKELQSMTAEGFGDFMKAVVDIENGIMAVGGDLHADEEAKLLDKGSKQMNLWGINLHLQKNVTDFIEFDSMINIRPSDNNRSRGVENMEIQNKIRAIVADLIQ